VTELRFLVDEDVSPAHVAQLNKLGHYAVHVAHVGLAGRSDRAQVEYAIENTLIIITKNVEDFLDLAADVDVHPGMIVLRDGSLRRTEEWAWIEPVIRHLADNAIDPINKVVDVTGPGVFTVRDIPPP
jgi:predicted nuclease of predicted toxin-antitoxin system